MAEETTNPVQTAPEQAAPAPAAPAQYAPADSQPAKKGSPLLGFLTVLLILVGIIDVILWGVAGYYLIQNAQNKGGGESVQSVSAGGQSSGQAAGDSGQQDALRSYLQQMAGISDQETAVISSFGSVSGTNYTDDAAMYAEISEHTLPLCQQLNEQVLAIVPSDPEISQVHGIYRDYVTSYLNALSTLSSAIDNGDSAQAVEANNLINATNDTAVSYQQALRKLADQRGVTLNG